MQYIGTYIAGRYDVQLYANELGTRPLPACNHLVNHSPDGFAWGYGGSGPAQLALAICASRVSEEEALKIYQRFKDEVVAKLPSVEGFVLDVKEVDAAIMRIMNV